MKQALQSIFCVLLLPVIAAGAMMAPALAQDAEALIDRAMTGSHRSDANKARDKYRHPKETLLFFGLKPNMTVVEITPGA
ncbi:MAG TPA: methyltransferase, partial [Burkholderiales bacterium]|nr:methyltransferase [Burkholderiales bacterium]